MKILKPDNRNCFFSRRIFSLSQRNISIVRSSVLVPILLQQIKILLSCFAPHTPTKVRRNNYSLYNIYTIIVSYYYLMSRFFLREAKRVVRFYIKNSLTAKWGFLGFLLSGFEHFKNLQKIHLKQHIISIFFLKKIILSAIKSVVRFYIKKNLTAQQLVVRFHKEYNMTAKWGLVP